MTQMVSCQSLTAEARDHAWVSPCGICGQSGTGTGFSVSYSVLSHQYHCAMILHADISPGQ
jgi:hypothetical protein